MFGLFNGIKVDKDPKIQVESLRAIGYSVDFIIDECIGSEEATDYVFNQILVILDHANNIKNPSMISKIVSIL